MNYLARGIRDQNSVLSVGLASKGFCTYTFCHSDQFIMLAHDKMEKGKSPNKATEEFDVIVIGCGLSGLTAGYEIFKLDPNINLCLLEAKGTYVFILYKSYLCI